MLLFCINYLKRTTEKKLENYAKQLGFKLNPNEKIVDFVIKGLLKNKDAVSLLILLAYHVGPTLLEALNINDC